MFRKLLSTALLCCIANVMFAQMSLSGRVVTESGKPVSEANVWLEYTNIGTSTDANGSFSLSNIPNGKYTLRASSLNYDGVRLPVESSETDIQLVLKDSPFKLNEVVVTGTGTHNKLKNSPIAVDIISQKELQNVSFPSFENTMMALTPSLSFTPNAMGSNLQLNGLSNKYVLILVDGKRLAGDVSGNIDLSRINMQNIKRIEILKGAASSLYGSEAIGGVINIITDKPKDQISVSSNTRYAEWGQFNQSLNLDINSKWLNSSTSYQRNQADGWQLNPQEIKSGKLVDTYKQPVNPYYSDVLTQRFTVDANKSLSMYVEGSLFDRKLKRSASYDYSLKYKDYSIGAGAKYMLKNKAVINLDMYTDNFDYLKVYTADSKTYKVDDETLERRQKYYDANLKGSFNAGNYNRITLGTQYQVNYLDSKSDIADGSRDVYTLSLYAQDEIRLLNKKLQLVPGIRYARNETFKNRLTPKMATMYSLDHFNFRASYAAGYRAPDLKYLFSNTESKASNGKTTLAMANRNLNPESSNYYSLNAEYFNSFFNLSVNGYINDVKNLIKLVDIDPIPTEYEGKFDNVKQYTNASKVKIKGLDINLNSYFGYGLSLGLGYSYVDSKDYDTHKQLEKISRHTGTVNANWNKKWWILDSNINFNGRLQSKRYYAAEDGRNINLWNLSTRHRFNSFNGLVLEPGFGVENIFNFVDDRPYGVNYATLSPGRVVYVSMSIKFSK
ncbi:MAG: TonB-dependent receptor [Dysgonomonas sp.]